MLEFCLGWDTKQNAIKGASFNIHGSEQGLIGLYDSKRNGKREFKMGRNGKS